MSANTRIADHKIENFFTDRWSPRAFSEDSISKKELFNVFEAARWAPSGLNAQPWRFVYTFRGEREFDAIVGSLWESNQVWAEKAAALIAVAAKKMLIPPGADTEIINPASSFDAGAAWGYLAIQAHLLGWATHAMGGFDPDRLAKAVDMPQGFGLQAIIAIGRPGDAQKLPESLRNRETPNGRRPVADSAFHGRFPL